MSKGLDCLGLGIAPIDILMQIKRFPLAGAKIDAVDMIIQGGGPIPTAMVTIARLGMKAGLIAPVGDDLFGQFIIDELKDEGVETSYLVRKKQSTAVAAGLVEKGSGRRTITLSLDIDIRPHDLRLDSLPVIKAVHLDGRYLSACIKLARWAHRIGAMVVFDIGSMRNDVSEILPMVDHLVCAEDFALPYTKLRIPRQAIKRLKKICNGTIVVTSGIKGALGFDDYAGYIFQPAYRVKTIDTTGAGDTYHGAYVYGMLKGWDLQKRMEFAAAAAAIKCMKPGGRTGIPSYGQVKSFLRRGMPTYA